VLSGWILEEASAYRMSDKRTNGKGMLSGDARGNRATKDDSQ